MLQQKIHELGKKTKTQKRKKREEEQEAQQPISDLMVVDLQSFLWISIASIIFMIKVVVVVLERNVIILL